MSDEQIDPRDRTRRLSLFLAGVMGAGESIALRHPGQDGSMNVTRDRLMQSRIPGMIAELEALLENTDPTPDVRKTIADLFTFGNRPHACMTGDCPHQGWGECVDAIRAEILQVDVKSIAGTDDLVAETITVPKSVVVGDVMAESCRVYVEDGQHWMENRDGSSTPLIILRADRVRVIPDP